MSGAPRSRQLQPGAVEDGEVLDPAALSQALQGLFSEHKLGKTVRLGIANQRVVVRTFELPLIEDPKEIETAVRFRAQDQIPMPLDHAVLDHRVVGGGTAGRGPARDGRSRGRRAPRHGLLPARGAARGRSAAGGIDLSAFGMIRALEGDCPGGAGRGGGVPATTALLPSRRRHESRGRSGRPMRLHSSRALRNRDHRGAPRLPPGASRIEEAREP